MNSQNISSSARSAKLARGLRPSVRRSSCRSDRHGLGDCDRWNEGRSNNVSALEGADAVLHLAAEEGFGGRPRTRERAAVNGA